jgi:nucleoside-diphosphate-sugar epimerase
VILRPSIVYGPFSAWSTRLVEALRTGQVALIDHGSGACNTTYVDNLVDAVFLSVQNERGVGETFFITDGEQVTWGDFIRAHVAMMEPRPEPPEISSQQIREYYRQQPGFWTASFREACRILLSPEFRRMLARIPACDRALALVWRSLRSTDDDRREWLRARLKAVGAPPASRNGAYVPDLVTFATETTSVFFRIDKAREILGYEPRILFARGIQLVEQWLRFANYL